MEERQLDRRALANAEIVRGTNPIEQSHTEVDDLFESDLFSIGGEKNSIVDAKNLSRKVRQCMEAIINPDTTNPAKIKIAQFLCSKLHGIYKIKR